MYSIHVMQLPAGALCSRSAFEDSANHMMNQQESMQALVELLVTVQDILQPFKCPNVADILRTGSQRYSCPEYHQIQAAAQMHACMHV